jgi:hypothetical protein
LHNLLEYSYALGNNFWYEFDNYFAWEFDKHPEADAAYKKLGDLLTPYLKYRKKGIFPQDFANEIRKNDERVNAIIVLAKVQRDILSKYFNDDLIAQQQAFEDFGQGVLFDDRPPRWPMVRIHMMEEGIRGYYRWHVFIRALVITNENISLENDIWLHVDRHVGLASAIHYQQQPHQSGSDGTNPNNPQIDSNALTQFRNFWLGLNFEQLDTAFDQYNDLLNLKKPATVFSDAVESTHELN